MEEQNILSLLVLLERKEPVQGSFADALRNNLIYYVPRIRNITLLERVVTALVNSNSLRFLDTPDKCFQWFEVGEAIMQWKLRISEPTIAAHQFFDIWDKCLVSCQDWSLNLLAMCCGILSTKTLFDSLQFNTFYDGSGKVGKYYQNWKFRITLPVWYQFLNDSVNLKDEFKIDILASIYATICEEKDLTYLRNKIHMDTVTRSMIKSVDIYFCQNLKSQYSLYYMFINNKINFLARSVECFLQECDHNTCIYISTLLLTCTKELLEKETITSNINVDYSKGFYFNVFLAYIVTLKGLIIRNFLFKNPDIFSNALFCLFNIHFISESVGTLGVEPYEFIYDICIHSTSTSQLKSLLHSMCGTIDHQNFTIYNNTNKQKINKYQILFLIQLFSKVITNSLVSQQQLQSLIDTQFQIIKNNYLTSDDAEIRSCTHGLILIVLMKTTNEQYFSNDVMNYINLSLIQYSKGQLNDDQFVRIIMTLTPKIHSIHNSHLNEILTTLLFKKLKESSASTKYSNQIFVLSRCFIYSIKSTDNLAFKNWINKYIQILPLLGIPKKQEGELINFIWDQVSESQSNDILKWWFDHRTDIQKLAC